MPDITGGESTPARGHRSKPSGGRSVTRMRRPLRSGLLAPPTADGGRALGALCYRLRTGSPVTNTRNTSSPHSRGWLRPESRCLAPVSAATMIF
jgi:hypothetical protein